MKAVDLLTGEALVSRTTARQRRIANWILFEIWITAGTVTWWFTRDILAVVGFMSLYAIWWGHLISWASETPVEIEED